MAIHPRAKTILSRLALIGAIAAGAAAPAAAANNVLWVIHVMPARTPAIGCLLVISETARGAVKRCLANVGVTPLPFEDFVVTAAPVCKTTHVATSIKGTGYVYSIKLSKILKPSCA